jgi:hypothetical protein
MTGHNNGYHGYRLISFPGIIPCIHAVIMSNFGIGIMREWPGKNQYGRR